MIIVKNHFMGLLKMQMPRLLPQTFLVRTPKAGSEPASRRRTHFQKHSPQGYEVSVPPCTNKETEAGAVLVPLSYHNNTIHQAA